MKLPSLDPAAKIELLEATRYYLEIDPQLAKDFVDRFESALRSIARSLQEHHVDPWEAP